MAYKREARLLAQRAVVIWWARHVLYTMQRLRQHSFLVVAIVCLLGASQACNKPSPDSDDEYQPSSAPTVIVAEAELARVSVAIRSDHVREVLDDGVITFAEYESSVLAMVACAEGGGAALVTGTPRTDAFHVFRLSFTWAPQNRGRAGPAVERCGDEFLGPLQDLWSKARSGSLPETEHQQAREIFWDCIGSHGITIGDRPRNGTSARYVTELPGGGTALLDCQEQIYQQFRIENFGG